MLPVKITVMSLSLNGMELYSEPFQLDADEAEDIRYIKKITVPAEMVSKRGGFTFDKGGSYTFDLSIIYEREDSPVMVFTDSGTIRGIAK